MNLIAIQGERGSNSHMAALAMLGLDDAQLDILPCALSTEVFDALLSGRASAAVLPIENSLHGAVAEHYDLLLEHPVRIDRESSLRIRHNLIAAPGVALADIRHILSHPVALSQCRHYLATLATTPSHPQAMPFYDTAGSVKHLMAHNLRDTAGIAPALAATEYAANILVAGIEDDAENFTRFHLLLPAESPRAAVTAPNKLSVAFAIDHHPGSLVAALQVLASTGVDLSKIESRPVPGSPWQYIFFVDFRFTTEPQADAAILALEAHCRFIKELGRYTAAI